MKSNIFKILKKELRETIRDKKSLMMMLIMPLFIPAFAIGMSFYFEAESEKDVSEYNKIGIAYEVTEEEKMIMEELKLDPVYDTFDNLKEKYDNGEINLYISKDGKNYTLHGNYNDNTSLASTLATSYLEAYKIYLQAEYLTNHDIEPLEVIDMIRVQEDIIMEENIFAKMITQECFMFLMAALAIAAVYAATDSIAGEKEKGTLETLLTFPVKAKDIILGKFLSISLASIFTGVFSIILMVISLSYINGAFTVYSDLNIIPNISTIIYTFIIVIIYSFFISGLCIAIASKTKSYKEAQSALTPISFVAIFPSMIVMLAGLETTTLLSFVPFLNVSLIFNDMLAGKVDILNLIIVAVSSIIFIAIVLSIIIKQYKSEKVLFSN